MSTHPDLDSTAATVADLLDGIGDDQLDNPTPCEDMTVGRLLDHVMGLTLAFRAAARKDFSEFGDQVPTSDATNLDAAWRQELPRRLEAMAAAWSEPSAWDGETKAGGITLPAQVMGLVALNELVIHGWDLARSTGQDFAPDDAAAASSVGLLSQDAPSRAEEGNGAFGRVIAVPDEASTLDRAVGLAGRDPAWKPAA
ncbi:MAG TPA: TIGR03086 family metal-binding protein [Stackebrandtia sp.]|jgi:uncharacterized protein (TIGR03086 family)|uniref:TIGR03086 family metal-binding protein n=1 Tax=Stackebrandtia sp. TaxID=2023065 RepID=UPI002D60F3C5|nr:TIGR03086 family metal-binding protein [Stackebrandtia sp.]HZE40076.1 TIGR03086 family metal-binding protein [Stackebrandtia sp.]